MIYSVYKIINLDTKKVYIGMTSQSLMSRLYGHRSRETGGFQDSLNCTIRELGRTRDKDEALELEGFFISINQTGYNTQGTPNDCKPGNRQAGKWNKELKGHNIECLEDNTSFNSIREAAKFYSIADSSLSRAIKKDGFINKINKTFKRKLL